MGDAKGKAGGTDCHTVACRAREVGQNKDASHHGQEVTPGDDHGMLVK